MSQITSIQQAASELFATNYPIVVQRGIDESTWGALCNTVYPGANPDSIIMAVDYCRARKLDIMLKPVHLVPMQVKDARTNEKVWRDVPMPGIGMYRIQADRSGNYAGADEPEFGPTVTQEFQDPYTAGKMVRVSYPEWCKYTVYKFVNGQRIAFTSKEYWVENYATQSSKTECPNAMWKKRPFGQLAKCFDEQTEVLTSNGFQPFHSVTGSVLQVTDNGLDPTDAKPFVQNYDGPMITADGTRLNFSVTPNHDMLTNHGKVEAQSLFDSATKDASKWSIPRTITATREDADIDDNLLRLTGYILADGGHTGHHQFRISVSRPYKVLALDDLNLHHRKSIKRDANRESTSTKRLIKTRFDKQTFTYDFALVSAFMSGDKRIEPNWIMQLSQRQAKIVVDALLEFDGSHNGSVRRLHQANSNVIAAFELLSVQAGYSINKGVIQKSDIGNCQLFTVSDAKSSPVVKGVEDKNSASLRITQNDSGKVWCVTVPTGIIVVRRNGFSMLCGNCSEAQALRKAWPEIGSEPTAEEMEGKYHADEKDITPQSQPTSHLTTSSAKDRLIAAQTESNALTEEQRKKLDELIDMMGLCQSIAELSGIANKVAEIGVIPDADKKAATKIYHDNKARILSAAVAEEEIPL